MIGNDFKDLIMPTTDTMHNKSLILTIVLLCFGYFIDFYDLTIFSACYTNVIKDLFHITNSIEIQHLYLTISNWYTVGIILGAITFGILGDKFGRSYIIRYSILIYSIAIILSVFTKSIFFFTFLRFVSGFGLATEFATSSVLIAELLSTKNTTTATKLLYLSGILGGICAVYIGNKFSWQIMFIFGGIIGIILYVFRKQILESRLFLLAQNQSPGNFLLLINSPGQFIKLLKLFIIIVPFNFIITAMFMLPSFMPISFSLQRAVAILLIGFFLGNIVSTFLCSYIVNYFKDYRSFIWLTLLTFFISVPTFILVNDHIFFAYNFILGLIGGGLPTIWIQMINKEYPTNIRNTASNTLYALGRGSAVIFNLFFLSWIKNKQIFITNTIASGFIISILMVIVLLTSKNTYAKDLQTVG
ncbi:MAG: transporter [Burkholderiales bacterium]|jgi:MFS family permease|nr:transporter [Burkholderiales bacterium]